MKRSVDVEDRVGTAGAQRDRGEIELVAVEIVFTVDGALEIRAGGSLLQLSLEVVDGLLIRSDRFVELVIATLWMVAVGVPAMSSISECLRSRR